MTENSAMQPIYKIKLVGSHYDDISSHSSNSDRKFNLHPTFHVPLLLFYLVKSEFVLYKLNFQLLFYYSEELKKYPMEFYVYFKKQLTQKSLIISSVDSNR